MKLLISNDDGIFAAGIRTLANALAAAGHEVTVVCPDRERSATGHGITMHQPIRAEPMAGVYDPTVAAWACSGTPADCVKLALDAILTESPDVVIAGINHGPNLGNDVLYSGTVSAAMEGLIEGIPSIAVSLASYTKKNFQPAADYIAQLVAQLPPLPRLLNVNVPCLSAAELKGVAVARLGIRRYYDLFEKRADPRGKNYYWLAGEIAEGDSVDYPHHLSQQSGQLGLELDAMVTDIKAVQAGYITVTPLHYDLTAYGDLLAMKDWFSHSLIGLS